MVRKVLLVCGILSSLLYVAMNVLGAMQWESYNSPSQAVSELSAIGAPSRPLWVSLGTVYQVLVSTFGWASGNRLVETALWASWEACCLPTERPALRRLSSRCTSGGAG